MMRIVRNTFIAFLSLSGVTSLYRFFFRLQNPCVRVIVFHDIDDVDWFKQCILTIKDRYHVLSPEAFCTYTFEPQKINVLITFDDGYASWYGLVLPVLEEAGIQGIFFVNSGLVDVYGDDEKVHNFVHDRLLLSSERKAISWEMVRMLEEKGQTIGGHTVTHARLSELQRAAQKVEVEDDRDRIMARVQNKLQFFAYPFGRVSDMTPETESIVRDAQYEYGFTTDASFVSFKNPYAISRLCIEDGLTQWQLRQWVEGGYDIYAKIKRLCVG